MRRLGLVVVVLALCATACGDDDTSDAGGDAVVRVSFDGSDCSLSGPAAIPEGSQTMVLVNSSDLETTGINLYVSRLAIGYGWGDHAQLWADYLDGGPIPGPVEWSHSAIREFSEPMPLAANEKQFDYTLEPGTHAINLRREAPSQFWLCGPVEVSTG